MSELGKSEILSVNNLHRKNKTVVCVLVFRFPSEIRVKAVRERVCKDQNSTNNMRMTMRTKTTLLSAVLGLTTALAMATPFTIVWNTGGISGVADPVVPTITGTSAISGISLTRGPDISTSSLNNAFSSSGWDSNEGGEYFEFGFVVAPGFSVDLSESFLGLRSSNTGPGTVGLFVSTDSFANEVADYTLPGGTGAAAWLNQVDNLSSLTNLTGTVTFRILKLNNTAANGNPIASTGTFAFGQVNRGSGLEPSGFSGTVIPEPSTVALLGIASVILYGKLRRRKG